MATFSQAIRWLKEGKKVRRPSWEEKSYWVLGPNEVITWMHENDARVHLNQIKAKDWEIYKEKQDQIKKINPEKLARVFHKAYEKISKHQGWKTQKKCQVKFDDLPVENKNAMILTAREVIHYLEEEFK